MRFLLNSFSMICKIGMLAGMLALHSGQVFAQVSTSWSFPLGGYIYSMPCVSADGTIYVGTQNSGYFYAINPDGSQKLYGGSQKWYYSCDVYATPALSSNGTIYLVYQSSNVGHLAAILPSHSVLWICPADGWHSPAVSSIDGTIFVASATIDSCIIK